MTVPGKAPFRAGRHPGVAGPAALALSGAPAVLLADISEFEPRVDDPAYLDWSQAIVIRAAYGTSHQDKAWYGGARRQLLHDGGARFLGIYQYLAAGQDGAAQADVLHSQVGALQPGEVLIADFEEGQHSMLTAWYNRMLAHGYPQRCLWTYTGLFFGQAHMALPVEWVAAYGQAEPGTAHRLWQFTDAFPVPGVGLADCSVFHGTISQLAALAYQPLPPPAPHPEFSAPRNVRVHAGSSTVSIGRVDPPASVPGPVSYYRVWVYEGSFPHAADLMPTYPRFMRSAPATFGALGNVDPGTHMTARVVAFTAAGQASAYADAHFEMP